jgi:hypothetical protein
VRAPVKTRAVAAEAAESKAGFSALADTNGRLGIPLILLEVERGYVCTRQADTWDTVVIVVGQETDQASCIERLRNV